MHDWIEELDPNKKYDCVLENKEGGESKELKVSIQPIHNQRMTEVDSVMVVNESNQPCYMFDSACVEEDRLEDDDFVLRVSALEDGDEEEEAED